MGVSPVDEVLAGSKTYSSRALALFPVEYGFQCEELSRSWGATGRLRRDGICNAELHPPVVFDARIILLLIAPRPRRPFFGRNVFVAAHLSLFLLGIPKGNVVRLTIPLCGAN